MLVDSAEVEFLLPDEIDPARSRLELNLGSSPLAVIKGIEWALRSLSLWMQRAGIQLGAADHRAVSGREAGGPQAAEGKSEGEIETAVAILSRRQRSDGGIGFWSATDWTTPWLSAYAGLTLLDARAAGVEVDDSVLARLGEYLRNNLKNPRSRFAHRWSDGTRRSRPGSAIRSRPWIT